MSGAPDSPRIRILPPLVFVAAFGLGGLADRLHPWPIEAGPAGLRAIRLAGLLLVVAGLALDFWSVGLFRRAGTSPLPFRPASAFVATGPYRFTRNPMYLGMTLLLAGVGLLLGRAWIALAAPVAAGFLQLYAIPREERYLERTFGESYRQYRGQVRRWL